MADKEKRGDIIPAAAAIPLKLGVAAVAISLGGIFYTFIRIRRNKPPKSKPPPSRPGVYRFPNSRWDTAGDRLLQDSSLSKVSSSHSVGDLSSSGRRNGNRDGFLLPEFSELVKECNVVVTTSAISPRENSESLVPQVESPPEYRVVEHSDYDREIRNLRCEVEILQEREKNLETQLLEYYGLKEQETIIMELQNRLKLNNMESKLYNLKIDSLKSDNRRLEAQVSDYGKVVTELEAAKGKIKVLRKKLRSEAERNKGQILNLQDRVMKLQEQEKKTVDDEHVDTEIQKKKELEEELEETKKSYRALLLEKSELAQKLEYVQMLATSVIDNEEVQELHKESRRLKQENEDLKKELDQMKADRCTDIEELVYLRWINACLRYELRNYKPRPGKTIARDLSKTLSPNSESRAKKLILEYANKEGPPGDKGMNVTDLDSDQWSSSHSYLTDSGEADDSSVDNLSVNKINHSSKTKVFAKLMRLLKRKDGQHNALQASPSPSRLERAASMDEIVSMSFKSSITDVGGDGFNKTSRTSSASSRLSLDLPRSCSRGQKSTVGGSSNCSGRASVDSLNIFRRIDSITEDENDTLPDILPFEDAQAIAKNELVKYAEALKNSRMSSFQKRPSTFDHF